MKPKMKPSIKATLAELGVGEQVEFSLYDSSENTIRSTATRLTKNNAGKFSIKKQGVSVFVTRVL